MIGLGWRRVAQLSRFFAVRRLLRDRRGAVTAILGLSALTFLGLIGLATEAGYWYAAHRGGQNAADAAAITGANTWNSTSDISNVVTRDTYTGNAVFNVATQNGYTDNGGTIRVEYHRPPVTGAYASVSYPNAVQAIVRQQQTISFARLFGISSETVVSTAVALTVDNGQACVLTLVAPLVINGTLTADAPNCMFASNNCDSRSINISGSSTVNVQSLHACGGCYGCSGNNVTPGTPYQAGAPKLTDPYSALNSVSWPSFSGGTCDNTRYATGSGPAVTQTLVPYGTSMAGHTATQAYCGDLHTQVGQSIVPPLNWISAL